MRGRAGGLCDRAERRREKEIPHRAAQKMEPVEARRNSPVAEQAHGNGNKTKGRRAEMGGAHFY